MTFLYKWTSYAGAYTEAAHGLKTNPTNGKSNSEAKKWVKMKWEESIIFMTNVHPLHSALPREGYTEQSVSVFEYKIQLKLLGRYDSVNHNIYIAANYDNPSTLINHGERIMIICIASDL